MIHMTIRPNETYALKQIGNDTTDTHNGKLEYMVYDKNGDFETTISVYSKWHHACIEKGYFANDGKTYQDKEDAIKASLIAKTDYGPKRDY